MNDSKTNGGLIKETDTAIALFQRALKFYEPLNDTKMVSSIYSLMAAVHHVRNELGLAVKMLTKAQVLNKTIGGKESKEVQAINYHILGTLCEINCKQKKAKEHYRKSLKLFKKLDDKRRADAVSETLATLPKSAAGLEYLALRTRMVALETYQEGCEVIQSALLRMN